ncbi:hypothetical protein, partial [Gallintestinimicrobium sp.]|uniref:hypothetical protein n=1 Tax=Gallintestinimicrobium sp. TaxID=2981655 RepID=UPI003994D222
KARLCILPSSSSIDKENITIECMLCEHSIVMNKKECALAHSRAEARLLRQPSTLAPSAHPRGAFIIVWKRSFLYDKETGCHR